MANANKPMGLTPVKYLNGADWDGRGNVYSIAASDATILSPGDPVVLTGTADSTARYPQIARATPGSGLCGVLIAVGLNPNGPFINPNDLTVVQKPASAAPVYYALVSDSPDVIYEVQENGTALAAVDVGLNCNIQFANPATGVVVSAVTLNNATKATTATLDVKILRLAPYPIGTNDLGSNAKWWVLINNHIFAPNTAGK